MDSTARMEDTTLKKSGPDKNENMVKGLSSIYMESKKQKTDKNENMIKGLSNIYMESKKRMTTKRPDTNILDSDVPDINVPIMEFSKRKRFNIKWVEDAKRKLADKIKQKSEEIAEWILKKEIKKTKKIQLPAQVADLIKLVMKSEYSKKKFGANKSSEKKIQLSRIMQLYTN